MTRDEKIRRKAGFEAALVAAGWTLEDDADDALVDGIEIDGKLYLKDDEPFYCYDWLPPKNSSRRGDWQCSLQISAKEADDFGIEFIFNADSVPDSEWIEGGCDDLVRFREILAKWDSQ